MPDTYFTTKKANCQWLILHKSAFYLVYPTFRHLPLCSVLAKLFCVGHVYEKFPIIPLAIGCSVAEGENGSRYKHPLLFPVEMF